MHPPSGRRGHRLRRMQERAKLRLRQGVAEQISLAVMATMREQEVMLAGGCHYCQGYLFSRPLPEAQFRAFLHAAQSVAAPT